MHLNLQHKSSRKQSYKFTRQTKPIQWLIFASIALIVSGCFQSAGGDVIEPTSVDLTQLATLMAPTATNTPFETPTEFPTSTPAITNTPAPETRTPSMSNIFPNTNTPESVNTLPPTYTPQGNTLVLSPTAGILAATNTPNAQPFVPGTNTPAGNTSGGTSGNTSGLPATPTALPGDEPCVHTVQPGEWPYAIARLYGVDPFELLEANPGINPDNLQVGQQLVIPNCASGTPTPNAANPGAATSGANPALSVPAVTPSITPTLSGITGTGDVDATPIIPDSRLYVVVEGDTLGSIAARFRTTVDALKKENNLTDDFLRVGQELRIPIPTQ
jgi:LysM repeat protein